MSAAASLGLAAFSFLAALGVFLWSETGSAVFTAMVESGLFICF